MKNLCLVFLLFISTCFAENPTIIVTCASGELGGAIAKQMAKENNLILTGRNIQKLQKLQEELRSNYPLNYEIVELDYCDPTSLLEFEKALIAKKSTISGLVLLTPRPQFCNSLLESEENWMKLFQSTFTGPIEALKKTLSHMDVSSKIVVIAGITSVQVLPEYGPVCIIRRMWTTYVKSLSHELGSKGICINALSPGVVLTDFHVNRIENQSRQNFVDYEKQMEQDVLKIPLKRHAKPMEIAKSVKFLLSKDSDFINGINLIIDGGVTLSY